MVKQDAPSVRPSTAARLFDLRYIMAALFAIYGAVVTVLGVTGTSPADLSKAGGWNVNLWCGMAMLAVAFLFAAWASLRPIRMTGDSTQDTQQDKAEQPA